MIAALRGSVLALTEDGLVLDVHGVGYLVFCSGRTLARLPAVGGEAALVIETQVREDHIHLFGFADALERDCFRLLSTVQGVGAKVALAILTAVPVEQMGRVLAAQDKAMLTRASGVGPKLAARIVSELKDKAARLGALPVGRPAGVAVVEGPAANPVESAPIGSVVDDATSALVNLGYGRADAWTAASEAATALGAATTVETVIGEALRALGRG